MTLRKRITSVGTAAVIAGTLGLLPGAMSAQAAPGAPVTSAVSAKKMTGSVPVTGTLQNGQAFTGTLSNLRTQVQNGTLMMTGTITGTGIPAGGTSFAAPVQNAATSNSCSILNLDLGPLHLNLLGLVVSLNEVVLNITAVPGAGNLLGNLLCAVTGLLDGGLPLQQLLSQLINQLLSGLGL